MKKIVPASQVENTAMSYSIKTARAAALGKVKDAAQVESSDTRIEIVAGSESVGYSMVNGNATPVYRMQIHNSAVPDNRPQEVITFEFFRAAVYELPV